MGESSSFSSTKDTWHLSPARPSHTTTKQPLWWDTGPQGHVVWPTVAACPERPMCGGNGGLLTKRWGCWQGAGSPRPSLKGK